MKSGLILFLIFSAGVAFGQDAQFTTGNSNSDTRIAEMEALKKELNAPERSNFDSDEAYSEAKKNWIEANPEAYSRLSAPPKSTSDRKSKDVQNASEKQ